MIRLLLNKTLKNNPYCVINRTLTLPSRFYFFTYINMKRIFYLLTLIFVLFSCSTSKFLESSSITRIEFGYGGGVTGAITQYAISKEGNLFKDGVWVKKLSKQELCSVFDASSKVEGQYNRPGNTFNYIRIVKSDKQIYYCWEMFAPSEVNELFTLLKKYL